MTRVPDDVPSLIPSSPFVPRNITWLPSNRPMNDSDKRNVDPVPGLRSAIIRVPASVPSLTQGSTPAVELDPMKKICESVPITYHAGVDAILTVPSTVPSLRQNPVGVPRYRRP